MDSRKIILKETATVALGEVLCSGVMLGVFATLGYFSMAVLLSALAGCAVITANYFAMSVTVSLASDRAKAGQVEQAKKMVQLSSTVRLVVMGVILFAGIKLGANVIALVLPLVFMRPVLMLAEFFRKKVD